MESVSAELLVMLKAARDTLQEIEPRLTQQQRRNLKRIQNYLEGGTCKATT